MANNKTQPLNYLRESASQTAGPYVHIGLAPGAAGFQIYERELGTDIAGPDAPGARIRIEGVVYDGLGAPVKDILIDCEVVSRDGTRQTLALADLHYTYRHSELPDGAIVVSATFRGTPGDPAAIQAEMDRIAAAREESQPLRTKTGGPFRRAA